MSLLLLDGFSNYYNAAEMFMQGWVDSTDPSVGADLSSGKLAMRPTGTVYTDFDQVDCESFVFGARMNFAMDAEDYVAYLEVESNIGTGNPDYINLMARKMTGVTYLSIYVYDEFIHNLSYTFSGEAYYEVEVIQRSTDAQIRVYVDDVMVIDITSNKASLRDSNPTRLIARTASSTGTFTVDDIYCINGNGSTNNTRLGPSVIQPLTITGLGDTTLCIPSEGLLNVNMISQNGVNDTTYNYHEETHKKDLYAVSGISNSSTRVAGVKVGTRSSRFGGSQEQRHISSALKIDGAEEKKTGPILTDEYVNKNFIFEKNPSTYTDFMYEDISSIQIGYEVA